MEGRVRGSFDAFQRVGESERVVWCNAHCLNCRSLSSTLSVREQLCGIVDRLHLPVVHNPMMSSLERKRNLRRCLCAGFYMQSA